MLSLSLSTGDGVPALEVTAPWGWPLAHLGGKAVAAVPDPQARLLDGGLPRPLKKRATPWRSQELALLLKKTETDSYRFRIRIYSFLHPLNIKTPIKNQTGNSIVIERKK